MQGQITDDHLSDLLSISTSNIQPEFDIRLYLDNQLKMWLDSPKYIRFEKVSDLADLVFHLFKRYFPLVQHLLMFSILVRTTVSPLTGSSGLTSVAKW